MIITSSYDHVITTLHSLPSQLSYKEDNVRFNLYRNYGAELVGKRNSKIWNRITWLRSNFHRKRIRKLTFPSLAHCQLWRNLNPINLLCTKLRWLNSLLEKRQIQVPHFTATISQISIISIPQSHFNEFESLGFVLFSLFSCSWFVLLLFCLFSFVFVFHTNDH